MSSQPPILLESHSLEETQTIGECLGRSLQQHDVIGLIGPLGAGKTALIQGIAAGAGVGDRRQVNSPTFVIVNEYEAAPGPPMAVDSRPLKLFHIDAYRLRGPDDLAALGFDEMVEQGAVLIEWADKVCDLLPPHSLVIAIEPTGPTQRRLTCAGGQPNNRLIDAFRVARASCP